MDMVSCEDEAQADSQESGEGSRRLQTQEANLVEALLGELPRPEPATAERLAALVCPCVTVKLDGTRTLVVVSSRGVHAHTLREIHCLASTCDRTSAFSAFDTEEVSGHFYVFDALFVNGVDVRHLPLRARLREAGTCLPAKCSLKRYYWGADPSMQVTIQRLVGKRLRLADGSYVHPLEGFVFTSLSSSYHEAPIKFKFHITCDFLIVSTDTDDCDDEPRQRRFDLYIQKNRQIERFWGHGGVQDTVSLDTKDIQLLGIPVVGAFREDNVIVELRLVVEAWVCVRRRQDRDRPNTLTTVLENIGIQRSGRSDARFLIKNLASARPALEIQNKIIDAMLRAVSTCAATIAGPAVGLFLPDAQRLERELGCTQEGERKAVGVIVPPPTFEVPQRPEVPASKLTMDQVVATAARFGWGCKWIRSFQGRDFQSGDTTLSESLRASLDSMQFLLLCNAVENGTAASA